MFSFECKFSGNAVILGNGTYPKIYKRNKVSLHGVKSQYCSAVIAWHFPQGRSQSNVRPKLGFGIWEPKIE